MVIKFLVGSCTSHYSALRQLFTLIALLSQVRLLKKQLV